MTRRCPHPRYDRVDDATAVCRICGMTIRPRLLLDRCSAPLLVDAINNQLRVVWAARGQAVDSGDSTHPHNRDIKRLRSMLRQVQETVERFGWESSV